MLWKTFRKNTIFFIKKSKTILEIFKKNRQKSNTISHNITYSHSKATSLDETVNMFKLYFESVYTQLNKICNPVYDFKSDINFNKCVFTVAEIFEILRCLSNDYKSDPDLIPEIIYLNCHYTLFLPIHYIFNLSLSTSCYPDKWRTSYVYPIFKAGHRNDANNYRPISRLRLQTYT